MNFEQVVVQYIYRNKSISLNYFGKIELEGNVPDPELIKKEHGLPVEGLNFTYNQSVETSPEFIDFYASEMGRNIHLSASDIDSHLHMARQLVNIGNPFDIPGLGKIIKPNSGILQITPGFYKQPPEMGSARPKPLKERVANSESILLEGSSPKNQFAENKGHTLKMIASGTAIITIIGLFIWAIFAYLIPFINSNKKQQEQVNVLPVLPDTLEVDTLSPAINQTITEDSNSVISWKAFIRSYNTESAALSKIEWFKSLKTEVLLEKLDTNRFDIYIPIDIALKDTAYKKDSLSKFYAYPVRFERITNQ